MIYLGNNEINGIYLGDSEISAIYAGETQIYPMNFGTITGITLQDLVWVTDVSAGGGTATSANCTFNVFAEYDSGKRRKVTNNSTVTGSLVVPETTSDSRTLVGTLTLTASYEGFSDSATVDVYQKAQTYNYIITYTTTDGNILTLGNTTGWAQNIVSHTNGRIEFDDDVTMIPNNAFSGCTTLETVNIPDTVTSYGSKAFYNCTNMTEFHIKSGITSIGSECFYMTSGELTIDSQYACSGYGRTTGYQDNFNWSFAAKYCGSTYRGINVVNFDKIIITADTVTYIGASAFHSTPVTEYVIGDYVNFFGGMAFARMSTEGNVTPPKRLQKFTIGTGLQEIGSYCFFYTTDTLNEIYYYPPTYSVTGQSGFFGSQTGTIHYKEGNTGTFSVPNGWTKLYDL